ncbi:MAG: ABC transporter permease [Anaerolineae bacterium]|nr:ABC transporter permease [Anaerolineae bacterium]
MVYKATAFFERDFHIQASYRLNFVLRLIRIFVATATFYFISQSLGTTVTSYLDRYRSDYFHFVLLGVAFYPFMSLSLGNMADAVGRYQQDGVLEILFISPTPILTTLTLSTLWNYSWTLLQALLYLLIAGALFQAQLAWANLAVAGLLVLWGIAANVGLGLINASFVLVTKRASPLIYLSSLATNLLAGLFYPVEVLPEQIRWLSYLLPATYVFDAVRQLLLQSTSLTDVRWHLAVLSGFALVLLPLGLITFRYAVRRAKIEGSLTQY